jgi:predicted amidohydrolase
MAQELVTNRRFQEGKAGEVPVGWTARSPRSTLAPRFRLTTRGGARVLRASGNGREDCVGHLVTPVILEGGRTYRMRARFSISRRLDPQRSLLFSVYAKDFNDGIFRYTRSREGKIHGENRFPVPGEGAVQAEVRVTFRASASGSAWIERVSLEPCAPVRPRLVRVACTQGPGSLQEWGAVLDAAGAQGVDLALLPEMMNGTTWESMVGPSAQLMRAKAKQHRMYVAGGIYFYDNRADRLLNRVPLFDRTGGLVGVYDKVHPYSPEILDGGVTAGTRVPVFETDFGRVGIMICYDGWFTDVAELLALRGAELILFPNAGYHRSLVPARAADNGVRLVVSSLNGPLGMWDTAGRDVQGPDLDATCFAGEERTFLDPRETTVGQIRVLTATLDLSRSPSPHNWGGPMLSAPGGRRNRRDQLRLLYRDIEEEVLEPRARRPPG